MQAGTGGHTEAVSALPIHAPGERRPGTVTQQPLTAAMRTEPATEKPPLCSSCAIAPVRHRPISLKNPALK
jgi:hypothetical protein